MAVPLPPIEVNPQASFQRQAIGEDGICVIVDDFLVDPDALVDFAQENVGKFAIPPQSYPGVVMDVAASSTGALQRFVRNEMRRHFPYMRSGLELMTLMSMMTLQPDELSNLQRLCHSDPKTRRDRSNYAGLLYLFRDEEFGGTGFYRWRDRPTMEQATALELEDPKKARAFLKERFPTYNEPPCYITDSNEIAELIAVVPACYNRWIFYSGDIPHSAYIKTPEKLSKDVGKGRLTLNCFASVIPY